MMNFKMRFILNDFFVSGQTGGSTSADDTISGMCVGITNSSLSRENSRRSSRSQHENASYAKDAFREQAIPLPDYPTDQTSTDGSSRSVH